MAEIFDVDQFREDLLSRNLYSVDKPYPGEPSKNQEIANAVNSVMNWVAPFKGFDLTNTVYGRLAITPNTPLARIGLEMLGIHLAYQLKSNLSRQYLPKINPVGALKGGKLVEFKVDFSITKPNNDKWYTNILDRVSGAAGIYSPSLINLTNGGGNNELMENTGKGQLTKLFEHINLNTLFKPYSREYARYAQEIGFTLKSSGGVFSDAGFIGYGGELTFFGMDLINEYTGYVRNVTVNRFANDYLGITGRDDIAVYIDSNTNEWVNNEVLDGGLTPRKAIVWGVDNDYTQNNIRHGILKNTLDLMVDSEGKLIDQTREVVRFQGYKPGFNGSPLVNRTYGNGRPKFDRQHTVNNQYNKLAKAIRFDGSKIYKEIFLGAKDSVIYDSVIPRVHPTRDDEGNMNIENLMFSIENLAVETKDSGLGYGWLDDGTRIPLSEVGVGGGRMMWFAPYDISFTETTSNRIESTVMMGRNEPMYNYQSSERGGTITLKLIIDHPPHVRSIKQQEQGNPLHRHYAEFFAFGGDYNTTDTTPEPQPPEEELSVPPPPPSLPEPPQEIMLYFAHDQPKEDNIDTVFDYLYSVGYEVGVDVKPGRDIDDDPYDGTIDSLGLNEDNFVYGDNSCITLLPVSEPPYNFFVDKDCFDGSGFSQYTNNIVTRNFQALFNFYSTDIEQATKYFKIKITATATKHHADLSIEPQYNLELSKRRTEAAQKFIKDRLISLFPQNTSLINSIEFELDWDGSVDSEVTDNNVDSDTAKRERVAKVEVARNNLIFPDPQDTEPIEEQQQPPTRTPESEFLYKHRGDMNSETGEDNGVLPGFSSLSGGYFYPTFHSQTPEELHRRLTFLQQSMRQGTSIRYESDSEGNNTIKNSVFGKQPISVLRYGDFIHSKIIFENITIDYTDAPLDFNPEGFGVQPMFADVTLQVKFIGGQSLKAPIDALQNALSFNYYANSSYSNKGMYEKAYNNAVEQRNYNNGLVEQMRTSSRWNRLTE